VTNLLLDLHPDHLPVVVAAAAVVVAVEVVVERPEALLHLRRRGSPVS
jgi:hypothetical protein